MDFGTIWQEKDANWYESIVNEMPYIHTKFLDWYSNQNIFSAFEIGCGTGGYYNILNGIEYVGIDISKSAINEAQKIDSNSFFCEDLLSMKIEKKYDLVFSHSVVDHTPDIDTFFQKSIELSSKFIYHSAYQSISNSSKQHTSKFEPAWNIFYNNISIPKIEKLSKDLNCKSFKTLKIKHPNPKRLDGTIFIIEK